MDARPSSGSSSTCSSTGALSRTQIWDTEFHTMTSSTSGVPVSHFEYVWCACLVPLRYFIVDIFVSFRTAFYNELGELEHNSAVIRIEYLKVRAAPGRLYCFSVSSAGQRKAVQSSFAAAFCFAAAADAAARRSQIKTVASRTSK
eukprot:SAG31_NODE_4843_length_2910_cov_2.040911_1_plen_145_part_00